ncbi:MAG: class I SAM-dependent methyltransferase [Flavobacteriaceae bacterium]|nr:class I SAM-dependent methyltransferase [Flavobacteriaceae bacterium]
MQKPYSVGGLIYDAAIYDGMNTDMADLPFYERWMPQEEDAAILELCCGTGRLTLPLAQKGHQIDGVDFTPSMLEKAKNKASEADISIRFIEGDIRTLELKKQYDLVFIPFNSIHHMYTNADLFKALATVAKHLKPKGRFIFDCFNPDLGLLVNGQNQPYEISKYTTDDGRAVRIEEHMMYDSTTQVNRIKWEFYINDSFDSTQQLDMRLFFPQELDAYLQWNGFQITQKFGGFDEQPFGARSQKQVYVCRIAD